MLCGSASWCSSVNDRLKSASQAEAVELNIELADIYEDVEHYVEVIESLSALPKVAPTILHQSIVFAVELTGMYAKSLEIHQALIDATLSRSCMVHIAQAYIGMENLEEAISSLEFVLAINEGHDAAAILCADLYMETKEYEKALTLYHSALELNLPNRDVFLRLANGYAMVNNIQEAKVFYRRCIEVDPLNDEAFWSGCCLLAEENTRNASSVGNHPSQPSKS